MTEFEKLKIFKRAPAKRKQYPSYVETTANGGARVANAKIASAHGQFDLMFCGEHEGQSTPLLITDDHLVAASGVTAGCLICYEVLHFDLLPHGPARWGENKNTASSDAKDRSQQYVCAVFCSLAKP